MRARRDAEQPGGKAVRGPHMSHDHLDMGAISITINSIADAQLIWTIAQIFKGIIFV